MRAVAANQLFMYRKTEALAVHGAKIMQNLEFTKNGKTILFYQNEGDAKYRFKIKNDENLTNWLLANTKTHRVREDKIKYAVKGIFDKIKEYNLEEPEFEYSPTLYSTGNKSNTLLKSLGFGRTINPFNKVKTNRPNYVYRLLYHIDKVLESIYEDSGKELYYNLSKERSKEFFARNEDGGFINLSLNLKNEQLSFILEEIEKMIKYASESHLKEVWGFTDHIFATLLNSLKNRYTNLISESIEKIYYRHRYGDFVIDFGDNTQISIREHNKTFIIPQEAVLECLLYKMKKTESEERFRITLQEGDKYYREILTDVRTGYFGIDSLLEHLKIQ
ncbi:hypothetical protein ACILFS_01050 [Capnocytophaga canimorsus]|uniref:hypothetical protein n=1 Tax=Capnocytophaga canimorsus TaxID=28188 RepID=UPI0037CEB93A